MLCGDYALHVTKTKFSLDIANTDKQYHRLNGIYIA